MLVCFCMIILALDFFIEEEEVKLYFNNLLHFIGIHIKIHDTVGMLVHNVGFWLQR